MITFCRRLFSLLAVTAMAGALGGCFLLPAVDTAFHQQPVTPVEMPQLTATIKRGDLLDVKDTTAYIAAEKGVFAAMGDEQGFINHIYVKPGDKVRKGQLLLDLISEGELSRYAADQRKKQLEMAEAQYAQIKLTATDPMVLKIAELQVGVARSAYKEYLDKLARRQLRSPIDGEVEFLRDNLREGGPVSPNENLIHIIDTTKLVMYTKNEAQGIQEGMVLQATLGGKTYPVKVVRVPYKVNSEETVINGTLALFIMYDMSPLPPELCKHGVKVPIHFELGKRKNVVVLPMYALTTINGHDFVTVKEDGEWQEREIEVGVRMITEVEVLSGLKEGDVVLVK